MKRLAARISKAGTPKAGLRSWFLFRMLSAMHSSGWDISPIEKQHWIEHGWVKK